MVQLDLIELADLVRPDQIVAEILRQNPQLPVPVPLELLAEHAGISKIEAFDSEGFEGALLTNPTKSDGAIFCSSRSPRPRQRFTIGHELGHWFLPGHPEEILKGGGAQRSRAKCTQNTSIELEADHFASGLLLPLLWGIYTRRSG